MLANDPHSILRVVLRADCNRQLLGIRDMQRLLNPVVGLIGQGAFFVGQRLSKIAFIFDRQRAGCSLAQQIDIADR